MLVTSGKSERSNSLNGVSSIYTRHRVNQFGECILEERVGFFLAAYSF